VIVSNLKVEFSFLTFQLFFRDTLTQRYPQWCVSNLKTRKHENYRTTELQNYKTTELQNCRTTKLQNLNSSFKFNMYENIVENILIENFSNRKLRSMKELCETLNAIGNEDLLCLNTFKKLLAHPSGIKM
jgi:hypothetical protein